MRILTVRQPWAWAIIHGGKDVENRVRNIAGSYRGPVAIHAGLVFDDKAEDYDAGWEVRRAIRSLEQGYPADEGQVWASDGIEEDDPRFAARGAIIGIVDVVGLHNSTTSSQTPMCWGASETIGERGPGFCSLWAIATEKHIELSNPRPLAAPIPYKGALGMRTLPVSVEQQILAAVAS